MARGIEQFECVTLKYFKENIDKYEELNENKLIENTFFRELLFYRLECYFEKNYYSPLKSPQITNVFLLEYINNINEEQIHEELIIENKKPDHIILIKLYIRYLFHDNEKYILKYINKFTKKEYEDVKKGMKKLISNYKLIHKIIKDNDLQLGKFVYDYKYELYEYIDFINEDNVFVIAEDFNINYLYNCLLTKKRNLVMYNPLLGKTLNITNIDLTHFN